MPGGQEAGVDGARLEIAAERLARGDRAGKVVAQPVERA
jgi:hypothetical protein